MHRTGSYESQAPAGKTERLSRPNVKERGNSLNRVVSQSESGFLNNLYFGQAILFATPLKQNLPMFVSQVLEPNAYVTDALSLS